MATVFCPFSVEAIDEGEFVNDINDALLQIQKQMEHYRRLHGDRSLKAKASLEMKIELFIVDANDGGYGIKSTFKTKLPGRPASTSLAMAGETQDGQPAVLVRRTGSDRDDPRQGKMFKRDGQ